MTILYAATAFLSAALLFMVQPMFARQVLPLVGGAPAVWNTCQVFFQAALLLGYLYAHGATRWLGVRRHAWLHLAIVLLPLLCLPLAANMATPPAPEANPAPWLLLLMAASVGPPFLALSATAPLVQRWSAESRGAHAGDPYILYAVSNAGSLAALLAYPFLIEPLATLRTQSLLWSGGYIAWIVCFAGCAFAVLRCAPPHTKSQRTHAPSTTGRSITARDRLHWLALAGVPVAWLLGVTAWITTDLAPVPLLWVLPLALYLVTYIVAFSGSGQRVHIWAARVLPWAVCAMIASLTAIGLWSLLLLHMLAFTAGALVCHGELAQRRPAPEHLTEFYVWLSLGGVLGGLFNAIVAPLIFPVPWEYALAVAAACALKPFRTDKSMRVFDLAGILSVLLLLLYLTQYAVMSQKIGLLLAVIVGLPALMLLHFLNYKLVFAVLAGVLLGIDLWQNQWGYSLLEIGRSYFGVSRVVEARRIDNRVFHELLHGSTVHGIQEMGASRQCEPLTYYHRTGPLGEIDRAFTPRDGEMQQMGVVGLGCGSAACYAGPQRFATFFEIDPLVRRLAEDPRYFTFLSRCARSQYEIKLGDGRRLLEHEPRGRYTLLVLDAFSSDAVPVHLLTREALRMYLERLTPDGILVFHVSNRHLDLTAVLVDLAHSEGWIARVRSDSYNTREEELDLKAPSTYVVIARREEHLRALADNPAWVPRGPSGRAVWTDDYCNVISVLD